MRIQDLHVLPKFSDGWSYLYVQHCRVDQEDRAIALHDASGKVPVPCANLALLMLGPGVSITHAAISVLADHGCLVAWCGEKGCVSTPWGWARRAAPPTSCIRRGCGRTRVTAWRWCGACTS